MKPYSIFIVLALAVPGLAQTFKLDSVVNPAGPGSLQANWSAARDGSPLLSWIETLKDGSYTLRYSIRRGSQWSEPKTIAARRKFFRHPAELPEVIMLSDGTVLAHWVENPKEESEAEFLYVSSSRDGEHWTAPALAHADKAMTTRIAKPRLTFIANGNNVF